jgi:hypothetical protein
MPRALKIVLVVAVALALLAAAAMGFGYWWLKAHAQELKATGEQSVAAGEAFAAGRDQSACIDEAVQRASKCDGMMCEVRNRLFLEGCLKKATLVVTLCVGVPPRSEIMQSVQWALGRCQGPDEEANQRCSRLVSAIQEYCHKPDEKK